MPDPRQDEGEPGGRLPSQLSAVLRELARVPDAEIGTEWERRLAPGSVVGRYELVREIGRGGFGIVYEAFDTRLGRAVAFKAVKAGSQRTDVRQERLLREAEAAARLSHPNIVTLYDVARTVQGPYLVFELLRGQALARRIERGPLSVVEALRIAVEVARGLAHAHANGVVHRDLTPGNVFLCDEGHVKVLDFGLAYAFGRRRLDGGTPGYMAPEQQRGAPEDERTDVFALGVILHHMLTGELPFPAEGARSSRPVPRLDVPGTPALGDLVARMLERDPVKRPRDGGEVLAALSGFAEELQRTPSSGSLPPARRRRRMGARGAALVLAGAVAVVAGTWRAAEAGLWSTRSGRAIAASPSVAVLPFADLSPGQDKEYFADGLADEILSVLGRVEGLRVPGRTSSFFFKGKKARIEDIAKQLHVGAVLEGSVRMAGSRVRVTAQVVNVADGYRVWGETYDRDVKDIFAVQHEIAQSVADALNVRLVAGKAPSVQGHATENPEVYAQFLIGRQHYHRVTRRGDRLAVEAYEKALAIDPRYAPAWAGLGIPLFSLADEASTPAAVAAMRQRALAAAEKAVALAPDLPDALSSRGVLRGLVKNDWSGAKADLERAVALDGNDADTRRRYGALLATLGDLEGGIAQVRKAVEIDPLGQAWATLGTLYQAAGELDRSVEAYRRHLEISPESASTMLGLGRSLLLQSKPKEALALFERCPEEDFRLWGEAAAQHALGRPAASEAALRALVAKYAHASPLRIAGIHAWRGEKDAAFEWLDRALASPGALEELRLDAFFRDLRGDRRYAALLRKLNLPADR